MKPYSAPPYGTTGFPKNNLKLYDAIFEELHELEEYHSTNSFNSSELKKALEKFIMQKTTQNDDQT